jgi:hypothetical protein
MLALKRNLPANFGMKINHRYKVKESNNGRQGEQQIVLTIRDEPVQEVLIRVVKNEPNQ